MEKDERKGKQQIGTYYEPGRGENDGKDGDHNVFDKENLDVEHTSFLVGSTSSGRSSPFFCKTSKGKNFGLSFSSHSVCKRSGYQHLANKKV